MVTELPVLLVEMEVLYHWLLFTHNINLEQRVNAN